MAGGAVVFQRFEFFDNNSRAANLSLEPILYASVALTIGAEPM
jgi:hypothetical protein